MNAFSSALKKHILRTLRENLRRFLSIFLIVALGSGFMAGLLAACPDMFETADRYFDDQNWYDLDIKSALGFSEADRDALLAESYVEDVQASRTLDMVLTDPSGADHTARVFGILDKEGHTALNQPVLKEGRMPEKAGECVIQTTLSGYEEHPLKLGDTLKISADQSNYQTLSDSSAMEELTVVGYVDSAMCISLISETTTAGAGTITLNVFATEDLFTFDAFTDLYVQLAGAQELNTFHEDYLDLSNQSAQMAEELGKVRAPIRRTELEEQITDQMKDAFRDIEESGELIDQTLTAKDQLEEAYEKGTEDTKAVISSIQAQNPALAALLHSVLPANDASEPATGSWIVLTRENAAGYDAYKSNIGKVAALARVFPVFFFLVALLVALTTMTRLIDENRTEIGTQKALGVSNAGILAEYLFYALISSVPGCLAGLFAGFRLFPAAISGAYGMMFFLPKTLTPFRPGIAAAVAPITIGSILAATLAACIQEVRAYPAPLLLPKAPAPGKRIFLERLPFLWKRLRFLHKITARNLFRYHKRFYMTVIGIMGCSALLVTGFGLRDSVNDIVAVQFDELYLYDLTVIPDPGQTEETVLIADLLPEPSGIKEELSVAMESGYLVSGRKREEIQLTTPRDADLMSHFITLRERKSHSPLAFGNSDAGTCGVILTEKLCSELGLHIGEEVLLENEKGLQSSFVLTGIAENYLSASAYITEEAYLNAFASVPSFTTRLCLLEDPGSQEVLAEDLLNTGRILYAGASASLRKNFNEAIKSMNGVILVLLLAAGLLCMIVLYNLISINICERRKELATLEVLGFHEWETRRYIFRETNLLSLIGALLGLLAGTWLHSFVVRTIEIDQIMFGRTIHPESYLFAILITLLFTLLVNRTMYGQLRKIDMVEAMKAPE